MKVEITRSDLDENTPKENAPKKSSRQILVHEIVEGLHALQRSRTGVFISGLSAGMDIGFSLLLMAVIATAARGHLPEPVIALLMANAYAVGFLFVVIGRSELFTEQTTLAVLPVLSGKQRVRALAALWSIVLGANLLGGAAFAGLLVLIGPALGVVDPEVFGQIADHVTGHSWLVTFGSAILAGWLMGLMSWLVSASRDTVGQILIVWIIAFVIGICGLHHVVVGSVELCAAMFTGQDVGAGDYLRLLLMATAGNALGGTVFVALVKYGHAVRGDETHKAGPS